MLLKFLFKKKTLIILIVSTVVLIFPLLVLFGPGCDILESIAQSNKDTNFGKGLQLRVAYIHKFFMRHKKAFNSFSNYIMMVVKDIEAPEEYNPEDEDLANAYFNRAEQLEEVYNNEPQLMNDVIQAYRLFMELFPNRTTDYEKAKQAVRRVETGSVLK